MELAGYEEMSPEQLDATFAALADRTRRAILGRLASGEATVTELAEPFAMSQPAVSKHLKVLERAGLVTRSRDAQRRPCRLEARPLKAATDWLADYRDYWEASYQRLDRLLGELTAVEARRSRDRKKGKP
ncbi:MAG TPA: metalloregulator ArsR/SmtB family transcription factor [Acidimicrobiales bacterium]|nr:metalloregulator ArsR/SmtB family transcription factor [Acidimicrobiales bacterium]